MKNLSHPVGGPLKVLFGVEVEFGSFAKTLRENGRRMHI